MCFSKPKVEPPAPPPETLKQADAGRHPGNETNTNVLAIGTKKYQTKAPKGPSSPSQIDLSK